MANPSRRRQENVPGDFYVDDTCIDCDTCRWLAPESFRYEGGQSAVGRQPADAAERLTALQALVACPTASIGTVSAAAELPEVRRSFPLQLEGNVLYCGYHSRKSFGAASYLILRPEGNVLVDSPRFSPVLADRLEALGGVRFLFLTHGDDVADHRAYRRRFGCERILHEADCDADTHDIEVLLKGRDPVRFAPDLLLFPVPGHTAGSVVLLHADRFLFTGDHLAYSARLKHLYAFRSACWFSWKEQIRSMERIKDLSFAWVLPGHGRRWQGTAEEAGRQMEKCLAWMRSR